MKRAAIQSVAILGGGPAGAFAAERLASAGLSVRVFDEKLAWEKPCGGGLTHKAYSQYPFLIENSTPKRFVTETGRKITGYTAGALRKMEQYHWPGNVRELRNVVERAVALGSGPMIDAQDIWLSSLEAGQPVAQGAAEAPYKPMTIEEVEKDHILRTLNHTNWNKSQAATILQIERSTLDRKIKAYDIKR